MSSSDSSPTASFTPSIPSITNNPFIEQTNLPEGTLFIACGSILGGLFLAVVIWRIVFFLTVQRAAKASGASFIALSQNEYGGPFVDPVTEGEKPAGVQPSSGPRNQFFSPTAEVMKTGMGHAPVNPTTSYLPAGYYASPGTGAPSVATTSRPFSMAREGGLAMPVSQYTSHSRSPSRPSSPLGPPQPRPEGQKRQKPPSAYLDDLLKR